MEQKIGIIDSGLGGLTVAKEISKKLPNEALAYFGDTARCPYGNRTPEEVKRFALQMADYLMKLRLKAFVVACNTATALAYEELKKALPVPVVGVIEPGAKVAARETRNGKIGVIGTTRTIESGVYEEKIKAIAGGASVHSCACPDLVPLIERGDWSSEKAKEIVRASLFPLAEKGIDTLVLGCTHYPLASRLIEEAAGRGVSLVNPAAETAEELRRALEGNLSRTRSGSDLFFVSGDADAFSLSASEWLGRPVSAQRVAFK